MTYPAFTDWPAVTQHLRDPAAALIHHLFATTASAPQGMESHRLQRIEWLPPIGNIAIWIACLGIAAALLKASRKQPSPRAMTVLLAFILSGGFLHLAQAVDAWYPLETFTGILRLITALLAIATLAILLITRFRVNLLQNTSNISPPALHKPAGPPPDNNPPATTHRDLQQANHELNVYRHAIDQHAIVVMTDADGVITHTNQRFTDVSGYAPDELIGRTHRVVKSDTHPEQFFADLWHEISTGNTWRGEICNRRKDGTLYWVDTTIVPYHEPRGPIKGYISVRSDITALKQAQLKLSEQTRALEHANAELEQFVYAASHDLKSPLVTILGFASYMKADIDNQQYSDVRDYANRIESAAIHLRDNVDQLLELSRVGECDAPKSTVPIKPVITELTELLHEDIASRNITLKLKLDAPTVPANPTQLHQALLNLLTNAIRYGSSNPKPRIEIGSAQTANAVRIFVRDNGPGIAKEHHERIFRLFERLESGCEGTGIGLALVRRIAQAHNGYVWLESSPGTGTTFWLHFPT